MKYLVKIYPVSRHQNAITKLILRIIGPTEIKKAKELATKGGIITENLNKEAATYLADQLSDLGAQVEVEEMNENDSDPTDENFQVKLTNAGRSKLAIVKLVKEITGLGLKEAKELVDKLGVVAKKLSEKEAVRMKERLERKGARVEITQANSPKPIPEPDPEPKLRNFGISGTVTDKKNQPLSGLKVNIFYGKSSKEKFLGEVNTNHDGHYSKIFNEEEFPIEELEKTGSYVIIKVFEEDQLIGESSAVKTKGRSSLTINVAVEVKKDDSEDKPFRVYGTVRSEDGEIIKGVTIKAFDRDLRSEEFLGVSNTDPKGNYEILYLPEQFRRSEKETGDIVIKAYNEVNEIIAESDIHFNTKRTQRIDLTIPKNTVFLPSRYEVIIHEIFPILDGIDISELTTTDIIFLVKETGYSVKEIALLTDDARLARKTGITKSVFWGLGIQDFGIVEGKETAELVEKDDLRNPMIDLPTLLEEDLEVIIEKVKVAINENYISNKLNNELELIKTTFKDLKSSNYQESLGSIKKRYRTIAEIAELETAEIDTFEKIFNGNPFDDEIWDKFIKEEIFHEKSISSVKLTAQLGELIDYNTPFLRILKKERFTALGKKVESLRDLTKLEVKDWNKIISENEINPPGNKNPSQYAIEIGEKIESLYPTEVFRHRIMPSEFDNIKNSVKSVQFIAQSNKNIFSNLTTAPGSTIESLAKKTGNTDLEEVGDQKEKLQDLINFSRTFKHLEIAEILDSQDTPDMKSDKIKSRIASLQTFFTSNPEFDLRSSNIIQIDEEEKEQFNFEGSEEDQKRVKKQIMAYQRTFSIAHNADDTKFLLKKGYDSAHHITNESIESFSRKLNTNRKNVEPLYNNAIVLSETGNLIAGTIIPLVPGIGINTAVENENRTLSNALKKIDGYEDLFGSQKFCSCKHCRSIFGPTAYFVDLMRFTEEKILASTPNLEGHPLDLKMRRPDLWNLELSCENTNKLIPHISIVNEILSKYISKVESSFDEGTDPTVEEINSEVNSLLNKSNQSFSLPANIPHFELNILLSYYNFSLAGIRKIILDKENIYPYAFIPFSPEQIKLITNSVSDSSKIKRRYGLFPNENIHEIDLEKILNITDLTRGELGRIIKLGFINSEDQNLPLKIDQRKVEGEIQPVREFLINTSIGRLDKLHRFVRLWRDLDFEIEELDYLLRMILRLFTNNNSDIGIVWLSQIKDLQESLNMSVPEICSVLEFIPEESLQPNAQSHFDEIFNNSNLLVDNKKINSTSSKQYWHPPFDEKSSLENDPELTRLLGALGLNQDDFNSLMAYLIDFLNPTVEAVEVEGITEERTFIELNNKNLSLLYRHALVANKLELSIDELLKSIFIATGSKRIEGVEELKKLIHFFRWQKQTTLDIEKLFLIIEKEVGTKVFEISEEKVQVIQDKLKSDIGANPGKTLSLMVAEFMGVSEKNLLLLLKLSGIGISEAHSGFEKEYSIKFSKSDSVDDFIQDLQKIFVVNYLFEGLELNDEHKKFVSKNETLFSINLNKDNPFSMKSIRNLFLYKELSARLLSNLESFHNLLKKKLINSYLEDPTIDLSELLEVLSELLKQKKEKIAIALSILENPNQTENQFEFLARVIRILDLSEELTLSPLIIKKLISADIEDMMSAVNSLKAILHASTSEVRNSTEFLRKIQDKINEYKRNVLVDYILSKVPLKFDNRDDLFNFFLIDTQIEGCSSTSRIVEATGALQLYINRCLLNLEKSTQEAGNLVVAVKPEQIPKKEWEWRKNYRVWEANRKVFLYAENYIKPELRDIKSPQYKILEDRIYEQELNESSVDKMYREYLDGFDEVSSLKIVGSFFQPFSEGSGKGIVYLIGRSKSKPVKHFLREFDLGNNSWGFWKKIEVEMNTKSISPIIYQNNLYLFWIETVTKPKYDDKHNFYGYIHSLSLKFSLRNSNKIWSAPQEVAFVDSEHEPFSKLEDLRATIQMPFGFRTRLNPEFQKSIYPIHREELEDYTLDSRIHNRIFPFVQNGNLYFNHGKNELTYQLHLPLGHAEVLSNNGDISQKLKKNFEGSLDQKTIMIGSLRLGLQEQHFERPDLLGNSGVNLYLVRDFFDHRNYYFEAEKLQTEPFRRDDSEVPLFLGIVPANSILQPVNNHPHLHIIENQEGSAILNRIEPQLIQMISITTRIPRDLKNILFKNGLNEMLSLETQNGLFENRLITDTTEFLATGNFSVFPGLFIHSYEEYIWEIFFHAPFLIANKLSSVGKYKEAENWFRFIFNPTAGDIPFYGEKEQLMYPKDRNWRFQEFHGKGITKISEIFKKGNSSYYTYRLNPFNPHAIARSRFSAYQKAILMAYLDNLIQWGDYLFGIDTRESIGEATLIYIMAANILGKRPPEFGPCELPVEKTITYEKLNVSNEFLVTIENIVLTYGGFNRNDHIDYSKRKPAEIEETISSEKENSISKILERLIPMRVDNPIFCIPQNKDLLSYWDRLADRLFKIRNCMDLSGLRRDLTLFQPPIDPNLLVRAKAQGITIGEAMEMQHKKLPPYKFEFLLNKARDYNSFVNSFGTALLSALEKKDAEDLLLLRTIHLQNIQKLTIGIKEQQIKMAIESKESLLARKETLKYKRDYFAQKEYMNTWEFTALGFQTAALVSHGTATIMAALAPPVEMAPDIQAGVSGVGPHSVLVHGGERSGGSIQAAAQVLRDVTTGLNMAGGMASAQASYKRREEEWKHQKTLSENELKQINKDIIAAEIRLSIEENNLKVYKEEMEQSSEVFDFYKTKFTGIGLYSFLAAELQSLFRKSYNIALETSLMAQQAYHYDYPNEKTFFIKPGYWDSQNGGLLAGERLSVSLMMMEKNYFQKNYRKHEIEQSFSILQINPFELMKLKETGECTLTIPELFFDLFYPGHYRRTIKSVRLSVPCITGPYTNVSLTLSLLSSQIRLEPDLDSDPQNVPNSHTQTIATSKGQNDGGLFNLNFNDQKYLPFEGAGAVNSEWKLKLPKNFRQFNYNTISDALIHISYTSDFNEIYREKIEEKQADSESSFLTKFSNGRGLFRAFSFKRDYFVEFNRLLDGDLNQEITIELLDIHFPFFTQGKTRKIKEAKLILITPNDQPQIETENDGLGVSVKIDNKSLADFKHQNGNLYSQEVKAFEDAVIKEKYSFSVTSGGKLADAENEIFDSNKIEDIVLLINYNLT